MNDHRDDDALSPDDDAPGALSALFPRPAPPAELEARVAESLRRRWREGGGFRSRRLGRLAAAAVIFAAGLGAGMLVDRAPLRAPHRGETRYLLLLYGAPAGAGAPNDVAEHRRWARDLVGAGRELRGEKLAPGTVAIDGASDAVRPAPADTMLRGFFVFTARSAADAAEVARSSPHHRHGGRVVVREIEPT